MDHVDGRSEQLESSGLGKKRKFGREQRRWCTYRTKGSGTPRLGVLEIRKGVCQNFARFCIKGRRFQSF